jgi:hypothetical protein
LSVVTEKSWAITPVGVGRVDYSQNVEFSVEPIIRSYQDVYNYDDTWVLAPLETQVQTINIPGDTVVLLYDFLFCCVKNILLTVKVESIDMAMVVGTVFDKSGYQRIEHHHTRGVPVFHQFRITVTNHSPTEAIDVVGLAVNCMGLYTSRQEYYMLVTP